MARGELINFERSLLGVTFLLASKNHRCVVGPLYFHIEQHKHVAVPHC
jgi:hypothetical protein